MRVSPPPPKSEPPLGLEGRIYLAQGNIVPYNILRRGIVLRKTPFYSVEMCVRGELIFCDLLYAVIFAPLKLKGDISAIILT